MFDLDVIKQDRKSHRIKILAVFAMYQIDKICFDEAKINK